MESIMFSQKAFAIFALTASLATGAPPTTTTAPVTQPTAPNLEVHEWAVFIVDGSTGQLNPDGVVTATLPAFVTDHRYGSASAPPAVTPVNNRRMFFVNGMMVNGNQAAAHAAVQEPVDMDLPSPVGVIRLVGSADTKVDVTINTKAGNFIGSWPKAEERTNQLLWRDLTVSDQPATPLLVTGPNNWFTALRDIKSAYVSMEHVGCDRFLTYDVQSPYPSPLKIKAGKESRELSNTGNTPLHDLMLYQGDKEGWRMLEVGDLAPTSAASPKHASTQAATQATTTPVNPQLKLSRTASTQPSDLAAAWKPRIQKAGVDAGDAAVIQHLIEQYAFDGHRLTAVYRMDDAEFDRLLPIEVVPQPAKITRFGLVIVINADPSEGTIIDDLVTALGDNEWSKRDAAYHALAAMGPAAAEKLKTASKSSDLEVAWRAERLLAMMPAK
jgi:hypothetical protein